MFALSILFGVAVGFALGLTGGGGSLLAVPLLVYGLSIAPREAIGISLAAVGVTALLGVIPRLRLGQVETGTSLLFAAAGIVGAPLGTIVAEQLPETMLLSLFAVLMLVVAARMWRLSARSAGAERPRLTRGREAMCRRSEEGKLHFTSPCAVMLTVVGLATGFLTGMFGIGGGFIVVPALVLFTRMPIRRAVATSLLVIVLVSISGVAAHLSAGREISLWIAGTFVLGGAIGMTIAGALADRLPASALQKVFAAGIALVAAFIIGRTFI
jgi:uncharacterized membrane protein YfcA